MSHSETETPPADATGAASNASEAGPASVASEAGPTGLTRSDLDEWAEQLKGGLKTDGPDLTELQASIASLPDRIVDAIREAGKPAKAAPKTPATQTPPGGEPPKVKGPKSLRSMWFGDQ